MELIYGTGNPAKFTVMEDYLKELNVTLISLNELSKAEEAQRKQEVLLWKMQE